MINLLNELNNNLNGRQMTLCELDNYLIEYGFHSAYDDTNVEDALEFESISYIVSENRWVNVLFELVELNEESPIDSIVMIKRLEEI